MKENLEERVRQLEVKVENLQMALKLLNKPLEVKGQKLETFLDELSYPGTNDERSE